MGVLFLVSQLVLVVWLVLLPMAVARRQAAQRAIAWTAVPTTVSERGEGNNHHGHGLRRSSTWSGRSTAPTNPLGEHLRQRAGPGCTDPLDLQHSSQCISSNVESEPDGSGPNDGWEGSLAKVAVAALAQPLSPRYTHSPLISSPETEMESPASDPGRMWTDELGTMAGSGGIPRRLSPRSPRLQPLDQATISALLRTPDDPPGTKAGPPTAPFED